MSVDGDSLRFQRNVIERITNALAAEPCAEIDAIDGIGDLLIAAGEAINWERQCAQAFLWGSKFPECEGETPSEAFDDAFAEVFC